jgi:hypothetical protein
MMRQQALATALLVLLLSAGLPAQRPQPFPQPPPQPGTVKPAAPPPTTPAAPTPARPGPAAGVPNEATLGVPIYPSAQFITSYDAGRGQRFYIFGVGANFLEIVNFYRTALKNRGNELFESPPTHQFETGRFREETMAFPPSVTIKDYTFGGSPGYPNPVRGGKPERFATIIQIVPNPPGNPQ